MNGLGRLGGFPYVGPPFRVTSAKSFPTISIYRIFLDPKFCARFLKRQQCVPFKYHPTKLTQYYFSSQGKQVYCEYFQPDNGHRYVWIHNLLERAFETILGQLTKNKGSYQQLGVNLTNMDTSDLSCAKRQVDAGGTLLTPHMQCQPPMLFN